MEVVFDIEANGLDPDTIWCIIADDIDTDERHEFIWPDLSGFKSFSSKVTKWIGHNINEYDVPVIRRLLGIDIPFDKCVDTLVLSRLIQSGGSQNSLEYWGVQFGYPKVVNEEWSVFSDIIPERCRQDVNINKSLYTFLLKKLKGYSNFCQRLEHQSQALCNRVSRYGFHLNIPKAVELHNTLDKRCSEFETKIDSLFPAWPKLARDVVPKYKKDGKMSSVGVKKDFGSDFASIIGGPYSLLEWVPFNINSPPQVVARLDKLGWEPYEKTPKGSWKLSKNNIDTIPDTAPEDLKKLKSYLTDKDRLGTVEGWLEMVDTDSRLRGKIWSVGANTHRMSHQGFQMANVPSTDSPWGKEMRSCLGVADDSRRLVGADASGIQLRVLSHHMEDKKWQEHLVEGDIHQYHADLLGITRPQVKTFIYAWILNAFYIRLGSIVGGGYNEGKELSDMLVAKIPSLGRAKAKAKAAARRGYHVALDGRRIPIKSDHFALAVFLQGDEQCIMKKGSILLDNQIKKDYYDASIVAIVHDEWQIDSHKDCSEAVGSLAVKAIKKAGEVLKCRCPLDGEYKIGMTWADTH